MSDIAEMAHELQRALEMGGYEATERIGAELTAAAARHGLEALACDLEVAIQTANWPETGLVADQIAERAAELDELAQAYV